MFVSVACTFVRLAQMFVRFALIGGTFQCIAERERFIAGRIQHGPVRLCYTMVRNSNRFVSVRFIAERVAHRAVTLRVIGDRSA